ncbi:hypothetical protein BAZOLSSOX_1724 [uncultured Gammaproteobacteria bacterium]|jgi:ribosome-binding protein aMBF1 (putative translation factor)|nr:hypothetical protein BAZOLSSOX_1724 [uncultured Gammaproteobacteria bacterium]
MNINKNNSEVDDFFYGLFKPNQEKITESNAYLLMSQYLIQIEQALENQSMTQKDLADKIGTSASYISQFFNLNKLINLKTLAKIELALKINFKLKQPTITDRVRNKNNITQVAKDATIADINFNTTNNELRAA